MMFGNPMPDHRGQIGLYWVVYSVDKPDLRTCLSHAAYADGLKWETSDDTGMRSLPTLEPIGPAFWSSPQLWLPLRQICLLRQC